MPRSKPIVETYATAERLRWDVRWVVKKSKKWHIIVKEFGDDLTAATELYIKVKAAGRHYPTLRCRNSGFPPPSDLRPRWYKKKVKRKVGKRMRVVLEDRYKAPLRRLNREGTWWCPYCRELREFVAGYELPFIHPPVPSLRGLGEVEPDDGGLYCPLCYISTRDHNVRKWNPLAERIS